MGFDIRLSKLLNAAHKQKRGREIRQAAQRLVDPIGMGKEYQMLGVTGNGRLENKGDGEGVWPFILKDMSS